MPLDKNNELLNRYTKWMNDLYKEILVIDEKIRRMEILHPDNQDEIGKLYFELRVRNNLFLAVKDHINDYLKGRGSLDEEFISAK